ncbi:MAG: T9SS type A sorting domain-containing protein [Melioribacteraceae bacterium]|nr:T9SS type A sorting domain-containing protein [Melioribacteraceae bacterium]MCF8353419.1 T9SS type A sorting domain-containing protein [Melioribacteraceae bacterium]MCF8418980.1 T9SS type A sorting domain-containing protein [Melioribacteraceae bacterium]
MLFAQGWNSTVTINDIDLYHSYGLNGGHEIFANDDGIHVAAYEDVSGTKYLKYYLLNSSGAVQTETNVDTSISKFISITGDNNRIYLAYQKSSYVRIKYSTDSGSNWSLVTAISMGTTDCGGVDAVLTPDGINVTWAKKVSGDYETYYQRYDYINHSQEGYKHVTDVVDEVGTLPSITYCEDSVYIGYNTGDYNDPYSNYGNTKLRKCTITSDTWDNPEQSQADGSSVEKLFSTSSQLFHFYYKFVAGMNNFHNDLYVTWRNHGSANWATPVRLEQAATYENLVSFVQCYNGTEYVFYQELDEDLVYRTFNGSSWSSPSTLSSNDSYLARAFAVNNEIFVCWDETSYQFKQYDAVPFVPQNFDASFTGGAHPVLNWDKNSEPDIDTYDIYKRVVGETGWAQTGYVSGTVSTWTDLYVDKLGKFDPVYTIEYKIKAVDKNNHESDYTDVESVTGTTDYLWKRIDISENQMEIKEYKLYSNYPNPFNPTTNIRFAVPKASDVHLAVYNNLGEKIADLVNDNLEKGIYEVPFTGGNLSSGIYIYRLIAGDFVSTSKMILQK